MKFPQYRKYKNDQSYFMILDKGRFIEWKNMLGKWEKIEFEAIILPDRVYISDMLAEYSDYWDVISEKDYMKFLEGVKN
jgi:hypothetical protein